MYAGHVGVRNCDDVLVVQLAHDAVVVLDRRAEQLFLVDPGRARVPGDLNLLPTNKD